MSKENQSLREFSNEPLKVKLFWLLLFCISAFLGVILIISALYNIPLDTVVMRLKGFKSVMFVQTFTVFFHSLFSYNKELPYPGFLIIIMLLGLGVAWSCKKD